MEEEQLKALNEIWTNATRAWSTLRDLAKRCASSEKDWKRRASSSEKFKVGYQAVLQVNKSIKGSIKAAEKIVDVANLPETKLEKLGIDAVIAELKKSDKIVDKMDAAIAKYLVWLRKLEKELEMEVKGSSLDMQAFMKTAERYMGVRSVLNKKLQVFQRMARV